MIEFAASLRGKVVFLANMLHGLPTVMVVYHKNHNPSVVFTHQSICHSSITNIYIVLILFDSLLMSV